MLNEQKIIRRKMTCTVDDLSIYGTVDAEIFSDECNNDVSEVHMHLYHELHFVTSGTYMLRNLEDTDAIILEPGMVVLIPPKYYHTTVVACSEETRKFSFGFECKRALSSNSDNKLYDLFVAELAKCKTEIKIFNMEHAVDNIRQIGKYVLSGSIASDIMFRAYYNLFISEFVVKFAKLDDYKRAENSGESDDKYLTIKRKKNVADIFSDNYSNSDFTIKDFARQMNLSERQANRVLAQFYGMSFRRLLIETRLNHAILLLERTHASIASIAEMVGYDSAAGFLAAFKNKYGITPQEYRKKNNIM